MPQVEKSILAFTDKQTATDVNSPVRATQIQAQRIRPYIDSTRALADPGQKLLASIQFSMALFNSMYYYDAQKGDSYSLSLRSWVQAYKIPVAKLGVANEPTLALIQTYGLGKKDLTPLLSKLKTRTLVVNGKQDHLVAAENAARVAKTIPHAKLLLLDQCGHFPFVEQPVELTASLKAFLRG